MRKIKKWRYYCEFCKKAGSSAGAMKRHEESCTMNPDRVCQMCRIIDNEQAKMSDMLRIIGAADIRHTDNRYFLSVEIHNEKDTLDKLREISGNCPMCILAALRQSGYAGYFFGSFNYQKEREAFWNEYNSKQNRDFYIY